MALWVQVCRRWHDVHLLRSTHFVVLCCCLGTQKAGWRRKSLAPLLVNNDIALGADPSSVSHQEGQSTSAQLRSKCWQKELAFPPPSKWLGFCSCRKVFWLCNSEEGALLTIRIEMLFKFLPSPRTSQTVGWCRLMSLNMALPVPHPGCNAL